MCIKNNYNHRYSDSLLDYITKFISKRKHTENGFEKFYRILNAFNLTLFFEKKYE